MQMTMDWPSGQVQAVILIYAHGNALSFSLFWLCAYTYEPFQHANLLLPNPDYARG
jgi:hypothetical protein